MTAIQLQIDGRTITLPKETTLLQAIRAAGASVPTLCHVDGLAPEGGCRLCIVEKHVLGADNGHDSTKVVAACHTLACDGDVIETSNPRIDAHRQRIVELLVDTYGRDALHGAEATLPWMPEEKGDDVPSPASPIRRSASPLEQSHPYLRFDRDRCIDCRCCLNTCAEVQGAGVFSIAGRGGGAHLIIGSHDRFAESDCVACGSCVVACPTHALFDLDRPASSPRPAGGAVPTDAETTDAETTTQSTCGYCGVGCQVEIVSRGETVIRIDGVNDAVVNQGHLCVKGRYAHAWHHSGDRITTPLLRDRDTVRAVSWDEALSYATRQLLEIRNQHGPHALGALASSRSTNEAAYLLQRIFRTEIGTNNVDCCARVCHSSTALALQRVTGTGAASASYVDIEKASCIVVAGANPSEAHPVVGSRIEAMARHGTPLIVIDPRRTRLAERATVHLQPIPGTNVPLFNGIARVIRDRDGFDDAYLTARCEGVDEFREFLEQISLEEVASITQVSVATIEAAGALLADRGRSLFVHGLGLSELTQGTESVMALCNLGMITGSIGRDGAGMLPLRGQNNVQGAADMGAMPNQLTGYQSLVDSAVRGRVEQIWGSPPPKEPGLTLPAMLDAAARGDLKALWIQGEDPAQSDPNQSHVLHALEQLDLLVVQEMFLTDTAKRAHLVLPAAGWMEQSGTFTNGERRVQRVRPAVAPPDGARPDWQVLAELGDRLESNRSFASPAEIMDEIATVAPAMFGGVHYARLGHDGLQWPCPSNDHAGTSSVHRDEFLLGKGRLVSIDYAPSPELNVEGYPYVLITGRLLEHYNVGTMTRRTPNQDLVRRDEFAMHPDDLQREGVHAGQVVKVESRWGQIDVPVAAAPELRPGTCFLTFHYPKTHANRLTGPQRDPLSDCPEYKVTSVRVRASKI